MCYCRNIETLPQFSIKQIRVGLATKGLSLGKLETILPTNPGIKIIFSTTYSRRRVWYENPTPEGTFSFTLRYGNSGLLLDIQREGEEWVSTYALEKRESNLKPGTYRYYFKDHYSQEGTIFEKLYYLPEVREFVSRSVLNSHRVRYAEQRKGHKDRYFASPGKIPEGKDLRYRKRHYRGKETPFWRRYTSMVEESEYKWYLLSIGGGYASGLIPPEVERQIKEEYRRI